MDRERQVLDGLVTAAREYLTARLRVSFEEIEVVAARAVVWPDAGL